MFEGEDDLIFPNLGIGMHINVRDMQICLFEVNHPEIKVPFINNHVVSHHDSLRTYSFLFSVKDLDEDKGALIVYNGLEGTSSARIIKSRNNVLSNFINVVNKIRKRENYNLIYFGERNEG